MCGGTDKAAKEAAAQQAQQQADISKNVGDINSAFAGRQPEYDKYRSGLQAQYQQELDRQQAIAGRNNKFALARSGLTGGSAAVDAGRLLGQEEQTGTLHAQQAVNSDVSKLQANDEATRQQMIALAQSGSDIGNAATETSQSLRANLGQASSVNAAQGLGDVFATTANAYNNEQSAAALRNGLLKGQLYAQKGAPGSLGP